MYYYIQPWRTIGYQSGGNSPALRPGIQLSQSGSFFALPRAIELIPEADQKQRRRRRGSRSDLLDRLRRHTTHVHQLIPQSDVQKPSLKPQTASNAGVEARWLGKTP
jgi:NAD(P)H-dependent FMN reductase